MWLTAVSMFCFVSKYIKDRYVDCYVKMGKYNILRSTDVSGGHSGNFILTQCTVLQSTLKSYAFKRYEMLYTTSKDKI